MATCVHHVPGRLRVRVPALSRSAERGERLRASLAALEGVRRVEVNGRAESVIVVYDPARLDAAAILERIGAAGPAPAAAALAAGAVGPRVVASAATLGGLFGRALFDAMLAKGVERSVRLLVGGR